MYIDESSYKAKIGVVSIDTINNKVIRIRYTYPKRKRNAFYVGIHEENWREAVKTAHIIDRDISIGNYDSTLARYKPNKAQTKVVEKPNLLDIWEVYKDISKDRFAATSGYFQQALGKGSHTN